MIVASNNHFAYSTPKIANLPVPIWSIMPQGYGYEGHTVDGTDLAACLKVIGGAVERARAAARRN